ncbi:MAG: RagB/SusD family nutrient uptake outer membrane protein, partial [Candidatus Marinimicrobia bacterium]|nr:RagB/SusD family nutrient uptake outer membrane protein [Candidatus Neomarinimicrobiota bacterium]
MSFKPILIILTAIAFIGCGELGFDNPNAPTIEIAEDIPLQNFVTGAEAGMRVELWIYLRDVSIIGREAYYFEPADPRYTGELMNNRLDPGGFLVTRPWISRYNVISNTETLLNIKALQLIGADLADEKAGLEGFAKTIQAYQLLLTLNLHNENGIQLDFLGELTPINSKSESFTAITNLLDEADTDLGNGGVAFIFELSSGFDGFDAPATFAQFNRALRARVAVYMGEYATALTALESSFIDETGDLNLGVYHEYGSGLGDLTNNMFESPTADVIKLMGHPTFETDAESGDSRFAAKVIKRPTSATFDNLSTDLGITVFSSSTDPVSIIRNEELILLRAEANIGLG